MTARFCYVVLAHTRTDAVVRLVRRIRALSPDAAVLVRHGVEADLDDAALEQAGARVLASPLRTEWGAWSLVDAELEAYAYARREIDPDYYVLVSGQDYPVTDLARWEREVAQRAPGAVLAPMEIDEHGYGYHWRIVRGPTLPPLVKRVADAAAWYGSRALGRFVYVSSTTRREDTRWWVGLRRRGEARVPVKASTWKTMSRAAVDAVLARRDAEPAERAWVASCKCPDELYVPTALAATPSVRVEHAPTTFASFAPGAPNPRWLTPGLVDEAVAAGAPFARKLAPDAPAEVVAHADAAARES